MPVNAHGQPVGDPLPDWSPPPFPPRETLAGRFVALVPLDAKAHGDDLFDACCGPANDAGWTYLGYGPFRDRDDHGRWLAGCEASRDPLFFAIVEQATRRALGVASYLRISPADGCIEVGHLHFGPAMRRGRLAGEAMWLMMANAFALGYRRYEWKCDALNEPSRRAAVRLGFTFEGVFRQATVYKQRNRDTAWYSIIDAEWPALGAAFETWLDDGNFDTQGAQRRSLSGLTAEAARVRQAAMSQQQ